MTYAWLDPAERPGQLLFILAYRNEQDRAADEQGRYLKNATTGKPAAFIIQAEFDMIS